MQKRYPASKQALPGVLREIRKAKRKNEVIAVVRFVSREPSLRPITNAVKNTKHLDVVKSGTDGGPDLFSVLVRCDRAKNLGSTKLRFSNIKRFRVCGVNTAACVMCTVESLAKLRIPVQVVASACANEFPDVSKKGNVLHHKKALKIMKRWKNVEVV